MDQFELIRTASRVYGKSIRQLGRETGHHRVTIRKALAGKEPQYRRQEKPRAPVMDPAGQEAPGARTVRVVSESYTYRARYCTPGQ